MAKEILPTTNKKFIQSIKKSMKVTKSLDKQLNKTTKRLNSFIKPLSKSNKLSKPFADMKKQITALNQAIVANDLASFQSGLSAIGTTFSELSLQSQQMIRSLGLVSKSYGLLNQAFQGSLTIDDTSLVSLDIQTKSLIQSFSDVQTVISSLKSELVIDSTSISTLIESGKKLTAEFSLLNQNMTAFTGTFTSSQSVVASFGGAVDSTLTSINSSINSLVSISENLGIALSNAMQKPATEVEKSQNSFEKLKNSLKEMFKPLEKGVEAGATFDELKGRVNKLDEALANVGFPDFQTSIFGVGKAFQSVSSQGGSMFQKINDSMSNTGENYSLLKKVFKGKLEIDDSNFKRMDENSQNLVRRFSDAKNAFKVFKGELNVGDDVFKELDKASQISVKRFSEMEKKFSSMKQTIGNTGLSVLTKIAPPQLTDPYATGEMDPTASLRSTLDFGLNDIKQKFEKFSTVGSNLAKSVQIPMKAGTTALGGMVQGLVSVMGIAMKAIAPTAIIGVALAGLALLDSQMDGQIGNMIQTAITKGPEVITGFVQGIIDKLPDLITSGTQLVAGLAEAISVNLPVIIQSGIALLQTLIDGVIANLPSLINSALLIIETLATSLLTAAPKLLMMGLELLSALVDGLFQDPTKLIDTVTSIIDTLTGEITTSLPKIIDKGIEILVKLAEGIASVLPQLIPVALEAITTLVRTLSENLPKILDAAVEIIGKLCEGLLANLPQILSAAVGLILALVQGIGQSIPKIAAAGLKIMLKLLETFIKAIPDLKDAGKNLIQGLIDGIGGMARAALDAVKDIAGSIGNAFKSIFKIHSPSRWMRDEIGAMLPAGLAIGIERNAHVIDQPMDDLASKVILPSLDSLDQQVDTVQKLSVHSSSTQTQQKEKQPATFNINFGNQQFKAFVSDISEAMGQDAAINLAF
ncbi:phage tail protein [Enterococcus termitis]|uniref:Phage tail protein n=1 Tax=Enterococcus termitis TaxID=332950 RepID=A0A1E5H5L0_9ENTE|nr:hypothetical protein [Enterococcus termitis]OEG20258.1 hypothetical protein BCR25_00050 [Enterococcus termitis]OJG97327.1 hypothetical protein RV18_GL001015 [Enterococcus termitis]